MMKLVLIRHGESEWNKLNLFTGWMDVDLSDKGREEAKNAGQTLKAEGYDFDVCYTSYLKRAIHTLNNVLAELDRESLHYNIKFLGFIYNSSNKIRYNNFTGSA